MSFQSRSILALILASLTFGAAGCSKTDPAAQAATDTKQDTAIEVSTLAMTQQSIGSQIDVTGTLAAYEEAQVAVEADGRVTSLAVDLGDKVSRGSILLRIAPEEYMLKKAQADAETQAARTNYDRLSELNKKELATKADLDEAKRRLDLAVATSQYQDKKLADTTLRSPIEGRVAKRLINLGEYAHSGSAVFYIVRTTPLKGRADVPERYVADVKEGAEVVAHLEGTDTDLKGKVTRISPAVGTDTRSFTVETEIANPDGLVKPGSFARFSIHSLHDQQAYLVPDSAIVSFAGQPRVYVADNGKAAERLITISRRQGDQAIVTSGLKDGDQIVTTGLEHLTEGAALKVRAAKAEGK